MYLSPMVTMIISIVSTCKQWEEMAQNEEKGVGVGVGQGGS